MEEVELADLVREAALRTPGVLGISPGIGYREMTYGPGVTVEGVGVSVQNRRARINVHVVVANVVIPELALGLRREIRKVVRRDGRARTELINIYVDDILFPDFTVAVTVV